MHIQLNLTIFILNGPGQIQRKIFKNKLQGSRAAGQNDARPRRRKQSPCTEEIQNSFLWLKNCVRFQIKWSFISVKVALSSVSNEFNVPNSKPVEKGCRH